MDKPNEFGETRFLGYLPRKQLRVRPDFRAFVKWDRPHKAAVMAEPNAAMETWFAAGVKFRRDPILGDTVPPDIMQHAMPREVMALLETAFGGIVTNVLEWKGITEESIGPVLMSYPALPSDIVAPFGLSRELAADFGVHVQELPWGPVYWTRRMPPRRRAEIVGSRWYYLQASRIYEFISEQWAKVQVEGRGRATWQIEKFLDLQRTLRGLNFDLADRVQYYECKLREFKPSEISQILAMLGKKRSPEAVKKSYQRQVAKLAQLRQENL